MSGQNNVATNLNGGHKPVVITGQPNGSPLKAMSAYTKSEIELLALGLRANSVHKDSYLLRLWSFVWETCWGPSGPIDVNRAAGTEAQDSEEADITLAVVSQLIGNNPADNDDDDPDDYCDNGPPDESYAVGMDVDYLVNSAFE